MAVSFSPLVAIIFVRPLASIERVKRKPVRAVAQQLITGKTKLYDPTLATGFGYRHSSRLSLEVTKRLPATLGITELSPKHGQGGATFSSRQRLSKLSCRHRGEKTFDLFAVVLQRLRQRLKLGDEHQKQLRLGSDDVFGNLKLRLAKLLPQLFTARLAEMVLTLGKTVPVPAGKLRQRLWGRILGEKIQGDFRFQITKYLQGARIILFSVTSI